MLGVIQEGYNFPNMKGAIIDFPAQVRWATGSDAQLLLNAIREHPQAGGLIGWDVLKVENLTPNVPERGRRLWRVYANVDNRSTVTNIQTHLWFALYTKGFWADNNPLVSSADLGMNGSNVNAVFTDKILVDVPEPIPATVPVTTPAAAVTVSTPVASLSSALNFEPINLPIIGEVNPLWLVAGVAGLGFLYFTFKD